MDKEKKSIKEITKCSECDWLKKDKKVFRCILFDGAIIEDLEEKQCKDSMYEV